MYTRSPEDSEVVNVPGNARKGTSFGSVPSGSETPGIYVFPEVIVRSLHL